MKCTNGIRFYGIIECLVASNLLYPVRTNRLRLWHTVNIGILVIVVRENLYIYKKKTHLKCVCSPFFEWQFKILQLPIFSLF